MYLEVLHRVFQEQAESIEQLGLLRGARAYEVQEERVTAFESIRNAGHPHRRQVQDIDRSFVALARSPVRSLPAQVGAVGPGHRQARLQAAVHPLEYYKPRHNTSHNQCNASFGLHQDSDGMTCALFSTAPVFLLALYKPNREHNVDFSVNLFYNAKQIPP